MSLSPVTPAEVELNLDHIRSVTPVYKQEWKCVCVGNVVVKTTELLDAIVKYSDRHGLRRVVVPDGGKRKMNPGDLLISKSGLFEVVKKDGSIFIRPINVYHVCVMTVHDKNGKRETIPFTQQKEYEDVNISDDAIVVGFERITKAHVPFYKRSELSDILLKHWSPMTNIIVMKHSIKNMYIGLMFNIEQGTYQCLDCGSCFDSIETWSCHYKDIKVPSSLPKYEVFATKLGEDNIGLKPMGLQIKHSVSPMRTHTDASLADLDSRRIRKLCEAVGIRRKRKHE